ncbi:MAG: orotate phosphoribosyltransferase [Bacteroidetes bacterium 4484_276]|nr:MAG: orotate phosphoribosyltransferase [Bacteroidetes bacterium 4484_276]
MKVNEETALKISQNLLRIKAIKLNLKKPYTWASGWKSPIYCDNRITLSYPKIRTYIRQEFVKIINEDFGDIDLIAGVATAGIAHGALLAQDLGLPFAYVRSSAKDHGLTNRIEGVVGSGQSVIVIEDLISTGGSSLSAVKALREAGANVKGLFSIFSYGFEIADEKFNEANCSVHSLSDYNYLIAQALADEYIREEDMIVLKKWRENPAKWKK